jgi:hypothetical protein
MSRRAPCSSSLFRHGRRSRPPSTASHLTIPDTESWAFFDANVVRYPTLYPVRLIEPVFHSRAASHFLALLEHRNKAPTEILSSFKATFPQRIRGHSGFLASCCPASPPSRRLGSMRAQVDCATRVDVGMPSQKEGNQVPKTPDK